jgi:hypothetical protein
VDERDFHPSYREAESAFREKAMVFSEDERKLRSEVRAMTQSSHEERLAHYVKEFTRIEQQYEKFFENGIAKKWCAWHESCTRTLYGPGGPRYTDRLVGLAGAPDERLSELAALAKQAGDDDLARAVAHTARQRGNEQLFREWVDSSQETYDALNYLERTPDKQRFVDRTYKAMRPNKADPEGLEPTAADRERASEKQRQDNSAVREFFGKMPRGPKRQVGSRFV